MSDSGLLDSILKIPYVTRNHSGTWDCRLDSNQANLSRSIAVMIISNKTKYCLATTTANNKGKYSWPRTIRGRTVRLACIGDGPPNLYAMHTCNEEGIWTHLETSQCPYIRETTKVLEQFSKVNMSIARGSVLESAKRLRNYTNYDLNGKRFHDPMDIVYIAKTITNYLDFVEDEKDLGSMLLDIVSQVMEFGGKLLQIAQFLDMSASKLVNATEAAASYTPSQQAQKANVALELFKVRTDNFAGITCTWFKSLVDSEKRTFQCNTANTGEGIGIHERHIDAGIQIPANLFTPPINSQTIVSQKLLVSVFKDSKLFPQNKTQTNYEVTSCVIGAKILNRSVSNLTDPIFIMLRAAPFHNELSFPRPVWWDPELNAGAGGWSLQGCHFSQLQQGLLVFACNRLGYYGLLQNVNYLNDFPDELAGSKFRLSPPALYVGGIILFICAWINIVTYLAYGNSIQMARRTKHSLINTWIAISLLCAIFTLGIFQTEDYKMCQGIGISIHYFSLCVILWICVGVSNMYKRISRNDRNISLPTDDLPKEHVGRKPILGLYLVGWGIALIICGISGSVNIREYASYSYCFLKSGPALSAVFVPAIILIAFLTILFVCIRCSIHTPDDIGHMSEGTQATENVDLDLLEPVGGAAGDRYRSISISTPTTSTQDDLENSNGTQLKAHVIVLFLYIVTWISAAISVATPFSERILYEEEVFSIIYAISASVLGFFLIFFYCIARSDVRQQWSMLSCRNFSKRQCCRSRSVSDTKEHNNIPPVSYRQQTTATMHSISRSNSQSSKNRGPSAASNAGGYKGTAVDLNMQGTLNRNMSSGQCHNSNNMNGNVNLVLLHRQQFLHNGVVTQSGSEAGPDVFYNPNQINVARKFFKKQKRLQKRNNFEIHRQRDNMDCMSEVSSIVSFPRRPNNGLALFSSEASKVNNTNIHLDKKNLLDNSFRKDIRQQNSNPNILSDSCNESDLIIDAERFVIGAENLRALTAKRAKVNNTPPIVANIYTNVPETSQPQHEIVTMKADDKYTSRKSENDEPRDHQDNGQIGTLRIDDKYNRQTQFNANDRDRFLIGEERTLEKNNSNTVGQDGKKTEAPHYVNENFRNMTIEENIAHNNESSEQLILDFPSDSINSPILAMNTVGLPMATSSPNRSHTEASGTTPDSVAETQILLHLNRDDEYISSALEISNRNPNDDDNFALTEPCLKSKSMNDLQDDNIDEDELMFECQTRSISCTNFQTRNAEQETQGGASTSAKSPVLFSPSLCDINDDDLMSPSTSKGGHHHVHSSPFHQRRRLVNLESTPVGSETNIFFTPEKIFPMRRNFTSSPTSESDINYQNSELSIRSHELYAPQQHDLDLNLTLTGEESVHYPYQPSEISDMDDDDDDDDDEHDYNNCSNDFLLIPQRNEGMVCLNDDDESEDMLNDSQTSIDELYQQITRRSISDGVGNVPASSIFLLPNNSTGVSKQLRENELSNENEEDSSQCSIISFVEGGTAHI